MKYEGISIKDKENIVKLVNELPICKLGKVTDVEIGLNGGKNMIRIKFNFNNEFNNLDMEYLSCLLSKNSFAIQSLIPEADLVDFNTNIYGLTCGYDAFEEAMSNII